MGVVNLYGLTVVVCCGSSSFFLKDPLCRSDPGFRLICDYAENERVGL